MHVRGWESGYVEYVRDTVCRIAVHASLPGGGRAVDLVVPADCPVTAVLPAIVDAVVGERDATAEGPWYLSRIAGNPIDPEDTLRQNAIGDGEVLLLAAVGLPPPVRRPLDACRTVAGSAPVTGAPAARDIAVGLTVLSAAAALAWAGSHTPSTLPLWAAATVSLIAAAATVATGGRDGHAPLPALTAAVFATTTGVLAAHGAPAASAALLAASAGLAVSLLLSRAARGTSATIVGAAAAAAAVCVAAAVALAAPALGVGTAGMVLAVVSLLGLSVAPAVAAAVTGLLPGRSDVDDERSPRGHIVLTGLIGGCSATTVLGTVVMGVHPTASPVATTAFAAVIGILLLLRARSHVVPVRSAALTAAGLTATAVCALCSAYHAPALGSWTSPAIAVTATAIAASRDRLTHLSPPVLRAVELAEYAALAAVVPVALWAVDAYTAVRALSLT